MRCPHFCARLRPSAVRVRIRSRSTSANPPSTASIKRPVLVPVSAHGSASDRNCALASTICLTMANRSKVERASRLMIAVLGGLADVERDLIRTRTAEGRSRAKARGQHMGRPPKLTPQQQKEARRRRAEGATLKELAKSYNVGKSTISRLDRE